MHLEQILIDGFKSFAVRTDLRLQTRRTVIVGPNGSGKSNILDAVRWVLGSQSARALRGNSMQDVIFSGTDSRAPARYAAVTLVFDNRDGYFPLSTPKVSVTRRLSRDGTSVYQLNGEDCRLRDIRRLFTDTGLGANGYGIVSQGRVAEILDADPVRLRMLFEGVAGISGLRERQESVRRSLEGLDGDLQRLQTILNELRRSLKPLAGQAEKAERYLTLKQSLDQLEVGYFTAQLEACDRQHQEAAATIAELTAATKDLAAQEAALALSLSDLRTEEQALSAQLRTAQAEASATGAQRADLAAQIQVLTERQQALAARDAELTARLAELEERVAAALAHHQELLAQIAAAEAEDARLGAAEAAYEAQAAALQEEQATVRQQDAALQECIYQALGEQADAASQLSLLERDLQRMHQVQAAQNEATAALRATLASQEQEQERCAAALAAASAKAQSLQQELDAARAAQATAQSALESARQRQMELAADLRSRSSQLAVLQEMEQRGDGYARSVQAVLQHAQKSGMDGVFGTVASLITPQDGYAVAVDVALGAASQFIVCRDDTVAAALIGHLQAQRLGRATFLPLNTVQPRSFTAHERKGLAPALTPAVDVVTCDPAVLPAVQSLLGRTLIARTLDEARQAARQSGYRLRIVTLDGTIIAPGGALTGGSLGARGAQLLVRQEEIRALGRRVKALTAELKRCEAEVSSTASAVQTAAAQVQALTQSLAGAETARQAAERALAQADAAAAATRSQLEQYGSGEVTPEALAQCEAEVMRLRQEQAERESAVAAQKEALAAVRAQLQQLADTEREAASARAAAEQQRDHCRAELARLQAERNAATGGDQQRLDAARADASAVREQMAAAAQQAAALAANLADLDAALAAQQAQATQLEEAWTAQREQIRQRETERDGVLTRAREAESRLKDLQVQDARWVQQAEIARTRLAEISEESGPVEPAADLQDAPARISRLKQQIRQLGSVNLDAQAEYLRLKERHDGYEREFADLDGARADVLATLSALDAQMASALAAACDHVNREFQVVFSSLFGGGRAAIEVMDPEHILDSGVLIRAQPPGKKLQVLSLLSGGERSLTALALIFAILRYKPSPIVILDEVDAALDEINVELLARYLSEFSATQFVIVSHRRPMMRSADAIYGASMEEQGVTKLVSTRLEQVAETGGAAS